MDDEPLSILVVEDEFLVASTLQDMLVDAGHEVIGIADDYAGALSLVEARKPDLALIDMHLIGPRTGIDVARALGARGVACVFATGNCPGEAARGLALACLHKPFSERDLLAAVEAARMLMNGWAPDSLPRSMHVI